MDSLAVQYYLCQRPLKVSFLGFFCGFDLIMKFFTLPENRGLFYRAFMAGGINYTDPDNPIDNKDHVCMEFFKHRMANVINKKWCKMLILLVFALYLIGACYGITQIKEGLERRKLSRSDSYSVEFFDREDDYYREFPYRMQVFISNELWIMNMGRENPTLIKRIVLLLLGGYNRRFELFRSIGSRRN